MGSLGSRPVPCLYKREGAGNGQVAFPPARLCCSLVLWEPKSGSLFPVAVGKVWVSAGIAHPALGVEPNSTHPWGEGVESRAPVSVRGSRCFSPQGPHQESHVLALQLAVACPNLGGKGKICPVSSSPSCKGLWGAASPVPPASLCPQASRLTIWLRERDRDIIPAVPNSIHHHHCTLPTMGLS